jgi:hypothetical protein
MNYALRRQVAALMQITEALSKTKTAPNPEMEMQLCSAEKEVYGSSAYFHRVKNLAYAIDRMEELPPKKGAVSLFISHSHSQDNVDLVRRVLLRK